MAGDVANVRMAALAEELGWPASEVSHVYAASATAAAGWPDPVLTIRPATAADRETIRPVHDQEFPATYAGLERLLPDEPDGKFHVLVAEEGSRFLGYAAGRVQPDGDGYLDYLAVPDAARGRAPAGTCSSPSAGTSSTPPPTTTSTSPSRTTAPPPAASTSPSASSSSSRWSGTRCRRHRGSPVHSAGESGVSTGHIGTGLRPIGLRRRRARPARARRHRRRPRGRRRRRPWAGGGGRRHR